MTPTSLDHAIAAVLAVRLARLEDDQAEAITDLHGLLDAWTPARRSQEPGTITIKPARVLPRVLLVGDA